MTDIVERLRTRTDPWCQEAAAAIEQLRDQCVDHQRLSFYWMKKHDQLLAFIQARPELLKELLSDRAALEPKP